MDGYVFISHSHFDDAQADVLVESLEAAGIRCWLDHREADIPPGDRWVARVLEGIEKSKLMVIIMSGNVNRSPGMLERELQHAINHHVPYLPISVEDVDVEPALRFLIGTVQIMPAVPPPLQNHTPRVVRSVRQRLTGESVPPPEQESPRAPSRQKRRNARRSAVVAAIMAVVLVAMAIGYTQRRSGLARQLRAQADRFEQQVTETDAELWEDQCVLLQQACDVREQLYGETKAKEDIVKRDHDRDQCTTILRDKRKEAKDDANNTEQREDKLEEHGRADGLKEVFELYRRIYRVSKDAQDRDEMKRAELDYYIVHGETENRLSKLRVGSERTKCQDEAKSAYAKAKELAQDPANAERREYALNLAEKGTKEMMGSEREKNASEARLQVEEPARFSTTQPATGLKKTG